MEMSQPKPILRRGKNACDTCRQLKIKCQPLAAETSSICVKCFQAGVVCIRPGGRSSERAALEAAFNDSRGVFTSTADSVAASHLQSPLGSCRAREAHRNPSSQPSLWSTVRTVNSETIFDILFQQCRLSRLTAESRLHQFRDMALYFPFIVLPSSYSLHCLARERPLLCLGVLACTSNNDSDLQSSLGDLLRKNLIEQVLVSGQKSLDLLSGLLVYLAWYHFFSMPRREHLGQLLSLAVSLCKDMGLTGSRKEAGVRVHRSVSGQVSSNTVTLDSEAQRLFLGTYYLERCYHSTFGTGYSLLCTDHVMECANYLSLMRELPTDLLILCLIQQQHAAEQSHHTFSMFQQTQTKAESRRALAELKRDIRCVENTLQGIKESLPPLLRTSSLIELSHCECLFYSFEGDLVNPFRNATFSSHSLRKDSGPALMALKSVVTEHCFHGAKQYLDTFLTIPASDYYLLSSCQWDGLTYAIVIMYQLSLGLVHGHDWGFYTAYAQAPLEEYLRKLCQQMAVAMALSPQSTVGDWPVREQPSQRKNLFSLLGSIWADVQSSFTHQMQLHRDYSSQLPAPAVSNKPMVSLSTKSTGDRCPARQFWK
ncbi:hypothetical protein BDV32DRAFT_143731 [Aspergillus pseudonomiae]|nr:hypothetical protein BDV32DRAFT_143731 [Aspergillus pseudonomiae]